MTPDAIIAGMRAKRSRWVDLEPGKRVRVLRPREEEVFTSIFKRGPDGQPLGATVGMDEVKRFVDGWDGFTEADLVAGGGESPVPFVADIWAELIPDRLDWMKKIAGEISTLIQEWAEAKSAIGKN